MIFDKGLLFKWFSQATPFRPDAEIFSDDFYGALQVTLANSAIVNAAVDTVETYA